MIKLVPDFCVKYLPIQQIDIKKEEYYKILSGLDKKMMNGTINDSEKILKALIENAAVNEFIYQQSNCK